MLERGMVYPASFETHMEFLVNYPIASQCMVALISCGP